MSNPVSNFVRRVLGKSKVDSSSIHQEQETTQPGIDEGIGAMGTHPAFHTKDDDALTDVVARRRVDGLVTEAKPLPQSLNEAITNSAPVAGREAGRITPEDNKRYLEEVAPMGGTENSKPQ